MLRDQRGVTLVETLVAVSILVLAVVSTLSVLVAGQSSSALILRWGDQTQELRVAMNQITSDMAYASWDSWTGSSGTIQITAYQPYTQPRAGADDWPGDLYFWPEFTVEYKLTSDGRLVRKVFDMVYGTYTEQTLVSGLSADSALRADLTRQIMEVRLRKPVAGGSRVAEVTSKYHLR